MNAKTLQSIVIRKITYSALCLALALLLPFLTGQIPQIGSMLCPMHLPVLLCGFLCGWQYGAVIGFVSPLLRLVMFGMPPFYVAIAMAFEMAVYGAVSGLLYRAFTRNIMGIYLSLLTAMIAGRLVWGAVKFVLAGFQNTEFSFALFISGAVTGAIPGIILQLILVPLLVAAAEKAKLVLD